MNIVRKAIRSAVWNPSYNLSQTFSYYAMSQKYEVSTAERLFPSLGRGGHWKVPVRAYSTQKLEEPTKFASKSQVIKKAQAKQAASHISVVKRSKPKHKKTGIKQLENEVFEVQAYSSAQEYDLLSLKKALVATNQYIQTSSTTKNTVSDITDDEKILHLTRLSNSIEEPQEIFIFHDGAIVFWNFLPSDQVDTLKFLEKFEKNSYPWADVEEESETMFYKYTDANTKIKPLKNLILLNETTKSDMEKYTISNALAMSVKLGMLEVSLDYYIERTQPFSEELCKTGKVKLDNKEVLSNIGHLLQLRHQTNLSSDLLDVPDFYWEHETLENLYHKTTHHFRLNKRTSVLNEKLNHCLGLMELLKEQLSTKHSHRLEWIIIYLILIEVVFEVVHIVR